MDIKNKIESLLFISDRPLSADDIFKIFDLSAKHAEEDDVPSIEEIGKNLEKLFLEYQERKCGMAILNNQGKYQMSSAPESARIVQRFLNDETTGELTRPQLETLTIIAYRGPMGKIELEQIRGVNCSLVLRNLLMRGLIEEKQTDGESNFSTTMDFLKFLGVNSVEKLPDYQKLHNNESINQIVEKEILS